MSTGIMPTLQRFGRPTDPAFPRNLDFVNVTNEDLGLTALLDTGVNDSVETSIPYPQEWDQDRTVVTLRKIQGFHFSEMSHRDDVGVALSTAMSYLDRSPSATFRGQLVDAEDEWAKSLFVGPMPSGVKLWPSATGFLGGSFTNHSAYGWEYVPEIPLSMFFPIYLDIWNNTVSVTLASGDELAADFPAASFNQFFLRYFYTIRRMNKVERDFMNSLSGVTARWTLLGS